MSKWLIKYYNITPAQSFTVFNLDVLDYEDYCSKNYKEEVQAEFDEYKLGVDRHGLDSNGKTAYNNKFMQVIESPTVLDAIDIFFDRKED